MITSVSLRNWKSHNETTVHFARGTNLLVGIMGSGKSSVLQAICFGLFGELPVNTARNAKLEDVVSQLSTDEFSEVSVSFESKEGEYQVKRRIENGATTAELRLNGKMVEGPQTRRVTDYVERILKVDYDLFNRAIYSEQNNIDYFLNLGKGERKRRFDQLLGIDRFETARANSTSIANQFLERKKDLGVQFSSLKPEETKRKLEQTKQLRTRLEQEIAAVELDSANLQKQIVEKSEQVKKQKQEQDKHIELRDRMNNYSYGLESVKKDLATKRPHQIPGAIEQKEKLLEELKTQISEGKKNLRAKEVASREASSKFALAKKASEDSAARKKKISELVELAKTFGSADSLEKQEKELREKIEDLAMRFSAAETVAKETKKALGELERPSPKCPVCDTELSEQKKAGLVSAKKEILQKKENELHSHSSDSSKLKKDLVQVSQQLQKAKQISSQLSLLEEEQKVVTEASLPLAEVQQLEQKASSELRKQMDELESFEDKLRLTEQELRELGMIKELTVKKENLELLLIQAKEEFTKNTFNEFDYEKVRKALEDLRVLQAKSGERITGLHVQAEQLSQLASTLETEVKNAEALEGKIRKIEETAQQLLVFKSSVVETQTILRTQLIEAINYSMTSIWKTLYPYEDFTDVRLQAYDDDYILESKRNDDWVAVEGIASGGERACACLAMRIALSVVLTPNLSWLILDEPTHNLDSEAVRTLSTVLHEHIPKIVEQTIVITHDDSLKDAASGKLYRFTRDKAKNEATSVLDESGG
ncbi:DNA double-strand break repair Rad50 ATPase [Candidatus Gugararchaeum adminiculabundum]|nr:DNA double-strand break repair Rad50 ATPase [Candidatus Gugararchaeum adminiculabundum]